MDRLFKTSLQKYNGFQDLGIGYLNFKFKHRIEKPVASYFVPSLSRISEDIRTSLETSYARSIDLKCFPTRTKRPLSFSHYKYSPTNVFYIANPKTMVVIIRITRGYKAGTINRNLVGGSSDQMRRSALIANFSRSVGSGKITSTLRGIALR